MISALRLSRYIRNGVVLFSMLGNFGTGYVPTANAAALNKQTVALQTSTLPATLTLNIGVGGLTYDVWYTTGACTAASVNESKPAPTTVRVYYQLTTDQFPIQMSFTAYGSSCVWMDGWVNGVQKLPATVYTTVTVTAPANAKNDGTIKITPAASTVGVTVGSAAVTAGSR